jgi:hypothetical protein
LNPAIARTVNDIKRFIVTLYLIPFSIVYQRLNMVQQGMPFLVTEEFLQYIMRLL